MNYVYALFFAFFSFYLQAEISRDQSLLESSWNSFISQHPSLAKFTSDEITNIANQWGRELAKTLLASGGIREIDPTIVHSLLTLLQESNVQIFMRHGEQQKTPRIQNLPIREQKIEMMRLPDNIENSLTEASIAEWMEGLIIWEYLKQKTGRYVILESSKNQRAIIPASALAYVLKAPLHINEMLTCINYPSSHELSNIELLTHLPDGTVPWEEHKVNAIIGPGTYEHITQNMKHLIVSSKRSHTIFIAITHTQQTNAIATLLDMPIMRLGNFGFILLTDRNKAIFPEGFYNK